MMKKKGNITFAAFLVLIVVCCGGVLLNVAANSRYNTKTEYVRLKNRYLAEGGIDTAVGLFINYLENRDLEISYKMTEDGYEVDDNLMPYLLDELKDTDDENVLIALVSNEATSYLSSSGYFAMPGSIKLYVNNLSGSEGFKLSRMCKDADFLISETTGVKKSVLNPVYLTVMSEYRNGRAEAMVKISGLKAARDEFAVLSKGDEGSVPGYIDTSGVQIEYVNYQNYGGIGK